MSDAPHPDHKRPYHSELLRQLDELKDRLPCCPNCYNWNGTDELCTYQGQNVRPPAPVIAFGCFAFDFDIPF